jgi:hypothetical protein
MLNDLWQNALVQHMIYSGVGAGLMAIVVTLAIEKWGGHIGGVLGTIPSTIVPASLGMWYSCNSFQAWSDALAAVPIGMMLNALFLWSWRIFPPLLPQGISIGVQGMLMSIISLLIWASTASFWVWGSQFLTDIKVWAIGATILSILVSLWITFKPSFAPKGTQKVPLVTLLSRGIFAGIAIAVAVYIAKQGQGVLAGIAAVFPAIFWTSMLSLWVTQGSAVPSGAVAPMMLGSSSVSVYALCAPLCVYQWGLYLGMMMAWCLSILLISIPGYLWLRLRNRTQSVLTTLDKESL